MSCTWILAGERDPCGAPADGDFCPQHQAMVDEIAAENVEASNPLRPENFRKVWVVELSHSQVMIEQFGDDPPSIAFRVNASDTWGRPYQSKVAP